MSSLTLMFMIKIFITPDLWLMVAIAMAKKGCPKIREIYLKA